MRKLLFSMVLIMIAATATLISQTPVPERSKILARRGKVLPLTPPKTIDLRGIGISSAPIDRDDTSSFRIHFKIQGTLKPGTWAIRVLDKNRKSVWTYSSPENSELSQFWSYEIVGKKAVVELFSTHESNQIQLVIDKVAIIQASPIPLSTTPPGGNQMTYIKDEAIPERRNWAKAVVRVRFPSTDDEYEYSCTGFLISPSLLMTNEHCARIEEEWRSADVDLDFDEPGTRPTNINHFDALLMSDVPRDFAIFHLKVPVTDRQPLQLDAAVPGLTNNLMVIQHPGGQIKQISLIDCRVVTPPSGYPSSEYDLVHLCDSQTGSSGSPVIDDGTKKVVALHHSGWNEFQVPLPPDELQVNEAILMKDIIKFIQGKCPDIAAEIGFPVTGPLPSPPLPRCMK
jgi:hypothetical protein